jgi:hypothetical protein
MIYGIVTELLAGKSEVLMKSRRNSRLNQLSTTTVVLYIETNVNKDPRRAENNAHAPYSNALFVDHSYSGGIVSRNLYDRLQ